MAQKFFSDVSLESSSNLTLVDGVLTVNDGNNYVKISEGSNSIGQIELKDSSSVFLQGWGADFRVAVNGTYNNHALIINNAKHATFYGDVGVEGDLSIKGATLQTYQQFQSDPVSSSDGNNLFSIGGQGMAAGYSRNVSIWSTTQGVWRSWVGTNLRFDGTNYKRASNAANNNWGNVAGIEFKGGSSGSDKTISFYVDEPENSSGGDTDGTVGTSIPSAWTALQIDNNRRLYGYGNMYLGSFSYFGAAYYAQSNTAYYVDPDGTSQVNKFRLNTTSDLQTGSSKLDVSGISAMRSNSTTAAVLYLQNHDTTTNTIQPYLFLSDGGGNRGALGVETSTAIMSVNGQGGLKFQTGASGVSGTEALFIDNSQNIKFNGAYIFPKTMGSAGQVLKVPSSGTTLEWGSVSGGDVDGTGAANRLAIWSDGDSLTSNVNITVSSGQLNLGNGLLVEDNDTTVITAKAYEPHMVWQKTRGSSGDDYFKIKAENDALAVDFTTARDGGSDTRVLRIDDGNRFVFSTNGAYAHLDSATISSYGRIVSNSDIRGTLFYDYDNTSYYVNPSGTSVMNDIELDDYIVHKGDTNTYFGFNGADSWKLHVGGGDRLIADTSTLTSNLKVRIPVAWDSGTLENNAIYAKNSTDGFGFGNGTNISTWWAWSSENGVRRMIDVANSGDQIDLRTGNSDRVRIDSDGLTVKNNGDIRLYTSGSQVRVGSFTSGSSNNGEYADDDIVVGDGSISIYPHRRGDYGLDATTATSTTFRSKLNIWSDNEDHITFGGASTHMVSAWESWKMWINNDSTSAGTLHLYNKNNKVEFARFSGDASSSFILGDFKATGSLRGTIFYDHNDTGYYVNPASATNINSLTVGEVVTTDHIYGRYVNNESSKLYRFGGLFFTWDSDSYGTNFQHSITSTKDESYNDNITLNSYGDVRINIDTNNNGTNKFSIGAATLGSSSGTLLTLEESGDLHLTGKVGINTTDPDGQGYSYAEDLVILGGNSASDGVGITLRGNGKQYGVIAFGDNADDNAGEIYYNHGNDTMSFRAATGVQLYLSSTLIDGQDNQFKTTRSDGFRIDSSSYARIELDSNDSWSYVRFQDNGSVTWDFATNNGGNLEIRPGGGGTNRTFFDSSGNSFSEASKRAPIFYDSADTTYYGDFANTGTSIRAAGTVHASNSNMSSYQLNGTYVMDSSRNLVNIGSITATGNTILGNAMTDKTVVHGHLGIGDDAYPKIAYPGQNALWSGSGSTTGQIVIDLPGTLNNYDMMYMEIDVYEYSSDHATKIIVGGHNWNSGGNSNTSTTQWYNAGVRVIGSMSKPIYLGRRNDGSNERRCIAIGETTSTWSYATVHVHKVHGAEFYSTAIDWIGDWNIAQTTSTSYFTKNPTTNFNLVTSTTLQTHGRFYSAYIQAGTEMLAPIFYDSNDTAYFTNPGSRSSLRQLDVHDGTVWDATTQGTGKGSIHIDPNVATDHGGGSITFGASDSSSGTTAQGGIYVRTDGSYGTRMYLSTTDSYATGSKTTIRLESAGGLYVDRGNFYAPIFYDSNNTAFYVNPGSTSVVDHMDMDSGNTSGKFAVKSTSVHGSYDFYNNGTTYLNGATTVDSTLDVVTGRLTLHTGGTNTYGLIAGYGNDNHFITLRGKVTTGQSTLAITGGHQMTFVEHADAADEGWYYVSKASGSYVEKGHLDGLGNMIVIGSHRAPIFYDTNNTNRYIDPAATTSLRTTGAWHADSHTWSGEQVGKIQYHSDYWYMQTTNGVFVRNSSGSNNVTLAANGVCTANNDWRAPQFYDSADTSYILNPNGSSNLYNLTVNDITVNGTLTYSTINAGVLEIDGYKVLDMPNNSTQRGPWNPIAAFVRGAGTAVYGDEDFVDGSNSVNVYNNQGGSGVQHFHEEDGTTLNQIAPNSSGKVIRIYNNGNNTSPGRGGFYQTISAANNQTFVQVFQAKLETGKTFEIAENAQGTNKTSYFLTDNAGTGKFEWYVRVSHCGDSGSFSSGGHIYVNGGSANEVFTWYLASSEIYKITDAQTRRIQRYIAKTRIDSPVYYDADNTNYLVNPASDSILNQIHIDDYIRHKGDLNTYWGFSGSDTQVFYAGGSHRMSITGDVHIEGTTDLNINGSSRRMSFTSGSGTIRTTTGNSLILQTDNTDAILIDGSTQKVTFPKPITTPHRKYCTASISNSYVRVFEITTDSSQLASVVKVTGTSHGNSHVGAFTAQIIVNHHQDVNITSSCGNYTDGVIKVESNSNGEYTMSYKSGSSNAATYYFTIEALSSEISISTNPTSTASTSTTHEHKLIFGTSMSAEGGSEPNFCFASNDGDTNVKLIRSGDGLQVKTGNSGQYTHEFHQGGTFYTKKFIDIDSTGYYLDPGSTSTSLKVAGDIELDNDGGQIKFTPPSYDDWEISVDSQGFVVYNTTDSRYDLKISGTGNATFGGSVTATADVIAYSDERLKTNIETLDGSKVYEMRGVSFTKDNKQGSGVIAQELEKVAPELVNNESEYKAVAYGNITGYLIEAIKDLKAEIEELKKQIK